MPNVLPLKSIMPILSVLLAEPMGDGCMHGHVMDGMNGACMHNGFRQWWWRNPHACECFLLFLCKNSDVVGCSAVGVGDMHVLPILIAKPLK